MRSKPEFPASEVSASMQAKPTDEFECWSHDSEKPFYKNKSLESTSFPSFKNLFYKVKYKVVVPNFKRKLLIKEFLFLTEYVPEMVQQEIWPIELSSLKKLCWFYIK
ncbi:hypothetical protein CEXT_513051 [Caerostris extrusa]|uniref:Uncharacterized protein n=1 Tax=Caerostris extrusa TaxID=172846 RepID=A0AAV4PMT2_CAEEX|nr:hypothetical protein CEXT_513051 [Caerostris extrusa]